MLELPAALAQNSLKLDSLFVNHRDTVNSLQQNTTFSFSLKRAIETAIKNNFNIQIAKKGIEGKRFILNANRSALLPSISGKSHYLYAPAYGYDSVVTNGGEYGLQLALDFTLYNGGLNYITINKAKTNITLSKLNLELAISELKYQVRTIYYEIENAKRELQNQANDLQNLKEYYNFLKESQPGGNITKSDVLNSEVDLNNELIKFDEASVNLKKLNKELLNLLVLPQDTILNISQSLKIDSTLPPEETVEEFIEVKIQKMKSSVNQFNIRTAEAKRLPVLKLSGDAGLLGIKPKGYRNDLGYSASMHLNVPIFTWGKINAQIQEAKVSYEQSKLRVYLIKKQLEMQKDSLYAEFNLAKKKINAYNKNIKTAEDNFLYAKALNIGGSGSTLQVLNAYRLLVDVKKNYNNAILSLQKAKAKLLRLYGK